jgi:hypothetical protein
MKVTAAHEREIKDGIQVVDCDEVQNFFGYLESNHWNTHGIIWRGHAECDWRLTPSLWRYLEKFKVGASLAAGEPMAAHKTIAAYWSASRQGLVEKLMPFAEVYDQVLCDRFIMGAYAQHHGAKSPLLDWTKSPFVAAFFAFAEVIQTYGDCAPADKCVAVWGLRSAEFKRLSKRLGDQENQTSHFDMDVLDSGFPQNRRLIAQQGLFTRTYPIRDLIEVAQYSDGPAAALIKVQVPYKETRQALCILNRMNVNYATLFPDPEGACRHASMAAVIEDYEGYDLDWNGPVP